jgi:hypothetical protein
MNRIKSRRTVGVERLAIRIRELHREDSFDQYTTVVVKHGYRLAQAFLAVRKERWFDSKLKLPKKNQTVVVYTDRGEMMFAKLVGSEPLWVVEYEESTITSNVRYWKIKPTPPGPWKVRK